MKIEVYEVDKLETTGEKFKDGNRFTFRIVDDEGRVIFTPAKRFISKRHAQGNALRYAAEACTLLEWQMLYREQTDQPDRTDKQLTDAYEQAHRAKYMTARFRTNKPGLNQIEFPNQQFYAAKQ